MFDKISTEFRGILRVFVNFAAPLLLEISEALYLWAASFTYYKLATKNLHLATTFLRLVAKRRPEDFFNFEPCTTGFSSLSPPSPPPRRFFLVTSLWRRPQDLNAWNRLTTEQENCPGSRLPLWDWIVTWLCRGGFHVLVTHRVACVADLSNLG